MTITPYISRTYQKKDGTFVVRICIYHKGRKKYLTTSLVAYRDQLTRNFTIKDPILRGQVYDFIRKKQELLNSLNPDALTLEDAIKVISGDSDFSLDFPAYGRKIASEKPKNSAMNYLCAVNSLCKYFNRDRFDISEITSSTLNGYLQWLKGKYGDGRAVSLYTSSIAYIHSRARKEFNDEELGRILIKNPFSNFKSPAQKPTRHRVIGKEKIQQMIDSRRELEGDDRLAVDFFLISFVLMGMNTPDIHSCKIDGDLILYERTKTRDRRTDGAEMIVRIEPEVSSLVGEYRRGDRFVFSDRFKTYKALGRLVNERLKPWGVTMYYARHSWASIAYSIGVDKNTINSCLCHVDPDMRVTDIYVERNWEILWEANSKVVRLFRW